MKTSLRLYGYGLLVSLLLASPGFGNAAELDDSIGLLDAWQGENISTSRIPKPLSQSAENITVVTSADIRAVNAHTLIDVLASVPGIQVESHRTPGSLTYFHIQGSSFNHILVLIDGVPFNNLADNFSDIGLIPANIIDRVEIVKGAASSSWGQALGGVINIITKSPDREQAVGGMFTTSYGEHKTRRLNAESSGTINRLGYYLSGGYSDSNGLLPSNQGNYSNAYAKLSYDLPRHAQLSGTFSYSRGNRGDFEYLPYDVREDTLPRQLFSTLSFKTTFSEQVAVEVNGRYASRRNAIELESLSSGLMLRNYRYNETVSGVGAKLLWRTSTNMFAAGVEYDHVWMRTNDSILHVDTLNRSVDRWGFYLNDTLTLGRFSFSPGARFDLTGTSGEQFSPSFGITWQLDSATLLRAYTAKGYSLPAFLLDADSEKVWTTQLGVESSSIAYLWLKGTLYHNDTRDITAYNASNGQPQKEHWLKQGIEVEAKTSPFFNTSLSLGYNFLDARNADTDEIVKDAPRHTLHLGLQYDDRQYLKGILNGRHIWWNAAENHNGSYGGIIWDVHLTATPLGRKVCAPEFFISIRNIFNSSQYLDEAFKNAGRWIEGGLRLTF